MKEKKNIVGLIGFILSLVSIVTFFITSTTALISSFAGLILSIIGLIFAKDYNNDKKVLSIAGIVISSIMLFISFIVEITPTTTTESKSDLKENTNNPSSTEPTNQNINNLSESDKMINKILSLISEKLAFDTGNYIQGDIPSGEYAFIKFNGSGSYYSEKDASGNIIDNENFDSFGYVYVHAAGNLETRGVLINVSAFEKLGVSSAKQIYEILNNQENWNQSGYYKVGVDIAPGSYVVESIGSGYYAIMTGPVGNSEIIDNDNYNGRASINITNGQYLDLSRSKITQ